MALYQLVRQIGRRNRLTLLSLCDRDAAEGVEALKPYCESIVTVRDQTGPLFSWLDAATSERPFSMARLHSRAVAKKAVEICEQRDIDLVHFDHLHTAAYVRAIPSHLPTLLREHNVESRILERFAEKGTSALLRPLMRRQARAVARYEGISCARFDRCLAVTEVDAQRLRTLAPSARIDVLPDGVDTNFFQPEPFSAAEPGRLVTTGDYSWRPTRDGLNFLTEQIFPRLRELVPEARLAVVGRGAPDALVRDGAARGIDVRGRVPDVRPEIARGAVFVSPTRIGSGIRIKILEAMALARPVVSTTIGAEGIEASDGEHLSLADEPQAIAEAIARLLSDTGRSEQMGRAASLLVQCKYSWDSLGDELNTIYQELSGMQQEPSRHGA